MTTDELLDGLTYHERSVIMLRHGLGDGSVYTLEECSRILRMPVAEIQEIEARAVSKIETRHGDVLASVKRQSTSMGRTRNAGEHTR
jgi:DNA-directed RNA polymerase sigma subunit (sigma70/sigma32)